MDVLLIINVGIGFILGSIVGSSEANIFGRSTFTLKPIMFLFPSYIVGYWLSYFLFSDIEIG